MIESLFAKQLGDAYIRKDFLLGIDGLIEAMSKVKARDLEIISILGQQSDR